MGVSSILGLAWQKSKPNLASSCLRYGELEASNMGSISNLNDLFSLLYEEVSDFPTILVLFL